MKALQFVLPAILLVSVSFAVSAKTIEITVRGVRSDRGNVLVRAVVAGVDEPVQAAVPAAEGEVAVTLEGVEGESAEISLFHDENGNYQLEMGDRGPTEGYALKKCKLTSETTSVAVNIFYPVQQ
jgi:uncharacterized protein (DUF2141 family)